MREINVIKNHTCDVEMKDVQRKYRRNEDLLTSDKDYIYRRKKKIVDEYSKKHDIYIDTYGYLINEVVYNSREDGDFSLYDFISVDADYNLCDISNIPYNLKDEVDFEIDRDGNLIIIEN